MQNLTFVILATLFLVACGRKSAEPRTYTEVIQLPPKQEATHQHGPAASEPPAMDPSKIPPPPPGGDIAWTVPAGWVTGEGSAMRLATLVIEGDTSGAFCSISLAGGSVEANVQRWLGQLGLTASVASVTSTIDSALGTVTLVDFLEASAGADKSLLGAIVPLQDGRTLFLKFNGSAEVLAEQRAAFVALCRSLRASGENA